MTDQTSRPFHWLRACSVALTSFTLIFVLILLLRSEPAQAGPQLPDHELAAARLNRPRNAPGTPALSITVEATSATVVPGQMVTYTIELDHVGGTSPLRGRLLNPICIKLSYHRQGLAKAGKCAVDLYVC